MLKIADRIFETTTTAGTGDITLAGAADGYAAFSTAMSVGDTTYYTLVQGSNWEVGVGTYSAPNTLQRTLVLSSSLGSSAITLDGSDADVFISASAHLVGSIPRMEVFTASGTWYKPPYYKYMEITVCAGGGGGQGASKSSAGGGASSGGSTTRIFALANLPNSIPLVIGAGGVAGVGNTSTTAAGAAVSGTDIRGGLGGDSTFGTANDAWYIQTGGGYSSSSLGSRVADSIYSKQSAGGQADNTGSVSAYNQGGGGDVGLLLSTAIASGQVPQFQFLTPCGGPGGKGTGTAGVPGSQNFQQFDGTAYWGRRGTSGGGNAISWPIDTPMFGSSGGAGSNNAAGAGGNGGNGGLFGAGGAGGGKGTTTGGNGGAGAQGFIMVKYYGG